MMQSTEYDYSEFMAYKPVEKVELNLADPFKTNYTEEENFRAYRMFSMIDLDGSGYITLREIERILMGREELRTLTEEFPHADTGIVFGIGVIVYHFESSLYIHA